MATVVLAMLVVSPTAQVDGRVNRSQLTYLFVHNNDTQARSPRISTHHRPGPTNCGHLTDRPTKPRAPCMHPFTHMQYAIRVTYGHVSAGMHARTAMPTTDG